MLGMITMAGNFFVQSKDGKYNHTHIITTAACVEYFGYLPINLSNVFICFRWIIWDILIFGTWVRKKYGLM